MAAHETDTLFTAHVSPLSRPGDDPRSEKTKRTGEKPKSLYNSPQSAKCITTQHKCPYFVSFIVFGTLRRYCYTTALLSSYICSFLWWWLCKRVKSFWDREVCAVRFLGYMTGCVFCLLLNFKREDSEGTTIYSCCKKEGINIQWCAVIEKS